MQVEQIADGVAAAVSHPITVQVINQGPGIWGNVATGLITAGAAIGAVMLTHRFTLKRERLASEDKLQRERYFIATELVFLLERYAVGWMSLGSLHVHELSEKKLIPTLDLSLAKGDWRTLSSHLIFEIRAFETEQAVLFSRIQKGEYNDYLPVMLPLTHTCLKTGICAFLLAAKIRRETGLPDSDHLIRESGILDTLRVLRNKYWKRIVRQRRHGKKVLENFSQKHNDSKGGA